MPLVKDYFDQLVESFKGFEFTIGDIFYVDFLKVISPYLGQKLADRSLARAWADKLEETLSKSPDSSKLIKEWKSKGIIFPNVEEYLKVEVSRISGLVYICEGLTTQLKLTENLPGFFHKYDQTFRPSVPSAVVAYEKGKGFNVYSVYSIEGILKGDLIVTARGIIKGINRVEETEEGYRVIGRMMKDVKDKEYADALSKLIVLQHLHKNAPNGIKKPEELLKEVKGIKKVEYSIKSGRIGEYTGITEEEEGKEIEELAEALFYLNLLYEI